MSQPSLPRYIPIAVTQEDLDWAQLPVVDFSKIDTPEGLAELTSITRDAMHKYGFMYVVNHGISVEENKRIFDIADIPFSAVSEAEKLRFESKSREIGIYRGYKPRQYMHITNEVRDSLEHYNVENTVDQHQMHPAALEPFLNEIRAFNEFNYYKVLFPLLRLLARGLEIPEDTFVNMHGFDSETVQTFLRFTKYYPYSTEEGKKANDVWFRGHTDVTTLSILWSQPVSGLQVMCPEGKWRWVRHIENALVVNGGDALEMLSGGYYKATIHRVMQPPADQRGHDRLCVFYFVTTSNDVKLVPLEKSPVLRRIGISRRCADEDAPTMDQWVRGRTKAYGSTETVSKIGKEHFKQEIMKGVFTTHYV